MKYLAENLNLLFCSKYIPLTYLERSLLISVDNGWHINPFSTEVVRANKPARTKMILALDVSSEC